jgi:hypothetical protein
MSVARSYASQLEKAIFQINTSSLEDLCQATRLCPLRGHHGGKGPRPTVIMRCYYAWGVQSSPWLAGICSGDEARRWYPAQGGTVGWKLRKRMAVRACKRPCTGLAGSDTSIPCFAPQPGAGRLGKIDRFGWGMAREESEHEHEDTPLCGSDIADMHSRRLGAGQGTDGESRTAQRPGEAGWARYFFSSKGTTLQRG